MSKMMTAEEAMEILRESPGPRVTEQSIRRQIDCHSFHVEHIGPTRVTVCFILMKNGFVFVGKAAAASPENHNDALGERYAYDDAFRQIWTHEGYLLREQISRE